MKIYLFLNSNDSKEYHLNTNTDFITELPEDLEGSFICGLSEVDFTTTKHEDIYIYTDIVEGTCVQNNKLPVLRIAKKASVFDKVYYFKVKQTRIPRLKVYIRNKDGEKPNLTGPTRCTLILKHVG
jgi:hypothetical protein